MIKKYTKAFVKNACALEKKLHGLNVPAAFDVIRTQKKVDTSWFYTWLFTKYSGYPAYGVTVTVEWNDIIYVELSGLYCNTLNTRIICNEAARLLQLSIASKSVHVSSHMFLDVYADMCTKFREHVTEQIEVEYKALLQRCKTLRVPFPCTQVQVAVPEPSVDPRLKPSLLLFRDPDSCNFVKLQVTRTQAEEIAKLAL